MFRIHLIDEEEDRDTDDDVCDEEAKIHIDSLGVQHPEVIPDDHNPTEFIPAPVRRKRTVNQTQDEFHVEIMFVFDYTIYKQ